MGLFSKKSCDRCGKECGVFGRTSTTDGKVLCSDCTKLAGKEFHSYEHTYDQYLALVERYNENEKKLQEFKIDKVYYHRIFVDTTKGWIAITESGLWDTGNMYQKHPHVYDVKDLRFFSKSFKEKKSESNIVTGTEITYDISMLMVFEDEFVPCPLNDVVAERKMEITGVFKKKLNDGFTEEDLELFDFVKSTLKKKGIVEPITMRKGDTLESLEAYAPWFETMFDLEKQGVIESKQVEALLERLTVDLGVIGSVKMPSQIRKRFGTK